MKADDVFCRRLYEFSNEKTTIGSLPFFLIYITYNECIVLKVQRCWRGLLGRRIAASLHHSKVFIYGSIVIIGAFECI